ncbi:hypothetical protein Msip34_1480 [Methylovorus glucosotrophus SIP3-4]|uniref:Uncharacterized protein n=1 Tax=Methylovorus glucosotrophus (strain SIP3-4) TaxID=582744 RepID=C6XDV0_METGS|nr:hypothetical protein Msip34_1480 [Methylovorus glucosotrophus SIP3-4]
MVKSRHASFVDYFPLATSLYIKMFMSHTSKDERTFVVRFIGFRDIAMKSFKIAFTDKIWLRGAFG